MDHSEGEHVFLSSCFHPEIEPARNVQESVTRPMVA